MADVYAAMIDDALAGIQRPRIPPLQLHGVGQFGTGKLTQAAQQNRG